MGGATIADIGVDSTSYTVYLNLLLTTKGKSSSCHTERRKKKLKCICQGRGGDVNSNDTEKSLFFLSHF
jgi:hypothetical protein